MNSYNIYATTTHYNIARLLFFLYRSSLENFGRLLAWRFGNLIGQPIEFDNPGRTMLKLLLGENNTFT